MQGNKVYIWISYVSTKVKTAIFKQYENTMPLNIAKNLFFKTNLLFSIIPEIYILALQEIMKLNTIGAVIKRLFLNSI